MVDARPYVVAVTGGIASGKSAVTTRLAEHGVSVLDADLVAREVVAPGEPALAEIVAAFGAGMLRPDGTLDRAALRALVFGDDAQRTRLEAIVHPRIVQRLRERAATAGGPYVVLAIPLLAETGDTLGWIDRVVVVDAPEALQLARLLARDNIDVQLARNMIAAQAPRALRRALADDILLNDASLDTLRAATDALHARLLLLAAAPRAIPSG